MSNAVEDYFKTKKELNKVLSTSRNVLDNEFDRICTVIKIFFEIPKARHYYTSSDEEIDPREPVNGMFQYYIEGSCYFDQSRSSTSHTRYSYEFPVKFFDMTNDEITQYLTAERDEYMRNRLLKKERSQKRKTEKDKKKNEILKKLSNEERKILGLK